MALSISNAGAKAALDALLDLLDVGGAGSLKIYAGTVPTDADTALGAQTLLATLTLSATGFANSTDANPGATASNNSISDQNASAGGTASFFRLVNNAGTCVLQGTVGTSGADLIVTTTTIVSGQPVHITSLTVTHPES